MPRWKRFLLEYGFDTGWSIGLLGGVAIYYLHYTGHL